MPTHKMHMVIASRVNKEFGFDNDSILLGSVLPDLTRDISHRESHFRNGEEGVSGVANPYKFLMKYKSKLKNPVMMGYLIHLLTDRFFNSYVFQNFYIYDENTHLIGIKFKEGSVMLPIEKIRYEKHHDFYVYDKYLVESGVAPSFSGFNCIDNVFDTDEACFDKKFLYNYICDANKDIVDGKTGEFFKNLKSNFKVMSLDELNKQLDICVMTIIKFIKNINYNE